MEKKSIILLHGALGSKEAFYPLKKYLESDYDLYFLNFEGHGKDTSESQRPFRIETFAQNVISFLQEKNLDQSKASIVGHSMGGYVALWLATTHPEYFHNIFTLGTKFFWTEESGKHEAQFLNPTKIENKVPHFASILKKNHGEMNWKRVVEKTGELLLHLGKNDLLSEVVLKSISVPVRIGMGDQDKMAGLDNGLRAYRALSQGEFFVLPRTEHHLEKMDFEVLSSSIRQFC